MTGVIVGKYKDRFLMAAGQQFILLAAPTGSGKGVACVIPNLLNYPDSVVVFDLKMENFLFTSGYRARHGQDVFLFAPFAGYGQTHRWNMLDALSRDTRHRVGDILSVGQVFYPSDCDPREKFWNDNARNLFLAFVLYLFETPALPCTMGEVFRQSSGKGRQLKEHIQQLIATRAATAMPLSDDCIDAFGRFLSAPENTLGNITTTFTAPLLVFANPLVDAATAASDFDLRTLRRKRTSIYIGIQPVHLSDAGLLVNMLFSQIISLNTRELPETDATLRYQCLLVLDEFPALGKIGILAKANAYIRGYNIRLLTIIQSISQLEAVYGSADTRTLLINHSVHIIFPPADMKDAKEYSELLGYTTVKSTSRGVSRPRGAGQAPSSSENTSEQRRALMLPQELREMDDHAQIVCVANLRPILCTKAKYFLDQRFIARLMEVSASLTMPEKSTHPTWYRRWLPAISPKKPPTEAALKFAAFVARDLSVQIANFKCSLAASRPPTPPTIQGISAIDLALLGFDLDQIPQFDSQEAPSTESAAQIVDTMFRMMGLNDSDSDDGADSAVKDDEHADGPSAADENTIDLDTVSEISETGSESCDANDLSALDE